MTDMGGKFRIITRARNGVKMEIDLGSIQSLTNTITASVEQLGITAKAVENAFVFDSGVTENYNVSFFRTNPTVVYDDYSHDSTQWSNGFWLYNMLKYVVNRYQALTDGIKIYYVPDIPTRELYDGFGYMLGENDNVIASGINCYVNTFTPSYVNGVPYSISGQINFSIGGLYLNDVSKSNIIYYANFEVLSNSYSTDSTNLVKYSDDRSFGPMAYPSSWLAYVSPDFPTLDPSTVYWSTSKTGSGDTYTQNDPVTVDGGGTLKLYARYPQFEV